ncbi:MAG: o-succinylbenzoate--CoA ligase [Anaerolineae bacterium]|nr:o-succinylbenzoate--CoA ligase [Anaerolineae bacterium]
MMLDWLAAAAEKSPDASALMIGGQIRTYRQLDARVDDWCRRFAVLGVAPGDRVAALLPNDLGYVCLIHALARLGAVLVPLNARLSEPEQASQIEQAAAGCVIRAADDLAQVEPAAYAAAPLDLDAVQSIVFTSGTTGKPKGAQITFGNLYHSSLASAERLGTSPDDRWLCPLQFYHVGGLSIIFRSAIYGSSIVLPESTGTDGIIRALHNSQATIVSLVPTQLYRMLEAGFVPPPSLRLILLGGAAANPELVRRCIERDLPISLTYGLTEATSQVATATPEQVRAKPGSVGKPLADTTVRIVDDEGYEQLPGIYGEIVVSGATVMKGYLGQPETNGAFRTGDIGYLDADGDLWIVQRRSDLIVSGGENVYPAEVEAMLRQHPAVEDACVVGVPDAEWGQRVTAMVVLREGAALSVADLIAYSRERLAGYKQPRTIVFASALPQTASGKAQRGKVKELMEKG